MQPLLNANLTLIRGDLSAEISEAEDSLKHYEEELRRANGEPSLVVGNK
jgi:hypothetical protein